MNPKPPTERQLRVIWLALTGLAVAVIVALIAGFIWGMGQVLNILSPVLWPLAVAGVLAYLLDPVVDYFERKGLSRPRAIICVFSLAMLIVLGLFGSIVPQIVRETRLFADRVPQIANTLQERVEKFVSEPPPWLRAFLKSEPQPGPARTPSTTNSVTLPPGAGPGVTITIINTNTTVTATSTNEVAGGVATIDKETLKTATGYVAGILPRAGKWIFGQIVRVASWFGVLVALGLVPVYAFYLLLEKRRIQSSWTRYLPMSDSNIKDELIFVLGSINDYLIAFFRGQVLVAVCDGILYSIGFLAIGLPYAILLGAAAIVLTMIPFLGAIITCIVALILAFVQYGDWLHPLLVLGVFAIVQGLEGFVISPKIMGDRLRLHPLTIIIAVMAGTTLLGGLLGGILAIPLTAVLKVVMTRYIWQRKEEGGEKS